MHLDIVVEKIEIALEKARECGAIVESAIKESAWGKIVFLSDPFGNGFCVVELVGNGYDEIAL